MVLLGPLSCHGGVTVLPTCYHHHHHHHHHQQLGCFEIPHNKHIRWWNNEWLARLLAAMAYQSYYMQQRAVGIMTIMTIMQYPWHFDSSNLPSLLRTCCQGHGYPYPQPAATDPLSGQCCCANTRLDRAWLPLQHVVGASLAQCNHLLGKQPR